MLRPKVQVLLAPRLQLPSAVAAPFSLQWGAFSFQYVAVRVGFHFSASCELALTLLRRHPVGLFGPPNARAEYCDIDNASEANTSECASVPMPNQLSIGEETSSIHLSSHRGSPGITLGGHMK